jgi:hypothetical protein
LNRWPLLASGALQAALGAFVITVLLGFYGSHYSVHQDLAGSALSGRLSIALGSAFSDYVTYFPPAERAWFASAAWLSDRTGLRIDLVVVVMTTLAVLFSTGLAYHVRRATVGASPLFFVFPLAILIVLPIVFKNIYGLREHMIALGMWPYLVLRLSDPRGERLGWPTRTLIGLWMGAMLLFKYLYSIAVFLVELGDALVQRRASLLFRVENIAAGAVVGLYLFHWLVLDASQREGIGAVFSAIDANLIDPRMNWLQFAINSAVGVFLLLLIALMRVPARTLALGIALVLGALAVAFIQKRWYSHHLFPITMAYILWWWMARSSLKWWVHLVIPLLLAGPIVREFRNTASYQQSVAELDGAMAQAGQSIAGKRVGILTVHPSPYNQYIASHGALRWNASMNNSYVASELKAFDRPENSKVQPPPVKLQDPGRRMLHDEMLRLWEDSPPDALFIDHSTSWPLRYTDVDFIHLFSQDRRFTAILSHYRPVLAHKGKKLEFRYYVRVRG